MGLKKKSKINAQFNMSALTDIIFLLLIFFMLTSTIVAPNALNLKLPGTTKVQTTSKKDLPDVAVRANGNFEWNRKRVSKSQIESELRKLSRGNASKRSFTISPDKKAPIENVVFVMDAGMRLKLNSVLLPEK